MLRYNTLFPILIPRNFDERINDVRAHLGIGEIETAEEEGHELVQEVGVHPFGDGIDQAGEGY